MCDDGEGAGPGKTANVTRLIGAALILSGLLLMRFSSPIRKACGRPIPDWWPGWTTKHLKKGDKIRLSGLGVLQVRKRAARMGRNPATGEAIKIRRA